MSWTNEVKPSALDSYLLKEDAFYLLLETGGKIVLTYGLEYTNKIKPTSVYTNTTKPTSVYTNKIKP